MKALNNIDYRENQGNYFLFHNQGIDKLCKNDIIDIELKKRFRFERKKYGIASKDLRLENIYFNLRSTIFVAFVIFLTNCFTYFAFFSKYTQCSFQINLYHCLVIIILIYLVFHLTSNLSIKLKYAKIVFNTKEGFLQYKIKNQHSLEKLFTELPDDIKLKLLTKFDKPIQVRFNEYKILHNKLFMFIIIFAYFVIHDFWNFPRIVLTNFSPLSTDSFYYLLEIKEFSIGDEINAFMLFKAYNILFVTISFLLCVYLLDISSNFTKKILGISSGSVLKISLANSYDYYFSFGKKESINDTIFIDWFWLRHINSHNANIESNKSEFRNNTIIRNGSRYYYETTYSLIGPLLIDLLNYKEDNYYLTREKVRFQDGPIPESYSLENQFHGGFGLFYFLADWRISRKLRGNSLYLANNLLLQGWLLESEYIELINLLYNEAQENKIFNEVSDALYVFVLKFTPNNKISYYNISRYYRYLDDGFYRTKIQFKQQVKMNLSIEEKELEKLSEAINQALILENRLETSYLNNDVLSPEEQKWLKYYIKKIEPNVNSLIEKIDKIHQLSFYQETWYASPKMSRKSLRF
jgi:hypothetical protein